MSRGTTFLRFFEPAIDPSLVEDSSRLLDYLNNFDRERLPRLLQRRDDRGYTLLHYAAERNQPQCLEILLVNEANPNIRSSISSGEVTPLHVAAANGNLACLETLVESGSNPLAKDAQNRLPRDHAQANGQDLCLEYLQKQSAEKVQQETEDLEGLLTFIQDNLRTGDLDCILSDGSFNKLFTSELLTSTTVKNSPKITPQENILSRRCNLLNNSSLVHILSRVTRDIPVFLHSASLLHAACHYGNLNLITELIKNYPNLITSVTCEGYTPVHIAVAHRKIDVLQILVDSHINLYRQRSTSGATPATFGRLHAPTCSQPPSTLLKKTNTGHTALHFATAQNDLETLHLFIRYQRALNISLDDESCGYTPLHLAIHLNFFDVAKLLLSNGAAPNSVLTDHSSCVFSGTPLADATVNKNKAMVELLVNHGAEDRRRDALNICLRQEDEENQALIPLLLGSLVKCDEIATKHLVHTQGRKDGKRIKMAIVDWGNLDMGVLKPEWVQSSFGCCPFFVAQSLEAPLCLNYVNSLNISKNKLTELPIEIFHLINLTNLNVSHNQLTSLPELGPMGSTDQEQPVWPCSGLNRLILNSNQLPEVPEYIFNLPSLAFLDLSRNHLEKLPFSIWSAPKLNNLNCSNNRIKEIPTNWPDVKFQFEVIDVAPMSPTQGSELSSPKSKGGSRKVSTDATRTSENTSLSDNRQTRDSNDTDDAITPVRARQTRLYDRLNVCNANLTVEWDAPEGREEVFDGLNVLNLSWNAIKQIPPNFPCLCPKLTRLDLSHNSISELAIPRAVPAGLKKLDVSNNEILILDSYRSRVDPLPCTNPKVLANSGGMIYLDPKFYCTHRSHNHLISLDVLLASHNEINDVKLYSPIISVAEGPCSRSNKIREVDVPLLAALASASSKSAETVRQLAKLACPLMTRLVLHHNQIPEVPLSVCEMSNLNSLDLSHNPIIELRPELGKLSNIWEFPLDGLKLISPPHNIIERGKAKDIIGFLWSLLQRARPYHRMKLMIVGKASRGKTTLLRRVSEKGQRGIQQNAFLNRMPNEFQQNLSTVGIVVSDWTYTKKVYTDQTQTGLRNITFMTWDFGGQEEYYATHQCFLSRRSLYIVVWNVLDGRAGVEELKPWLLNIQARAPHSPVIVVGTHLDKVKRSQRRELNENLSLIDRMYGTGSRLMSMKHGFPTIMANMVVSSTSGKNINDLRDTIFNVACNVKENAVAGRAVGGGRNPEYRLLMDQLVPASYLQLEDSVRNIALNLRLQGKPPVLTYKEFRDMIFADARPLIGRDIEDKELEQAVRFLHENGTLIHYDDPFLKELYFVDPQWLSDMLAHIVTVREINPFVRDGVMKIKDFSLLFNEKDFPIKWQKEYLRLLTTFEVAVEFKKGKLLIPSHLPEEKPHLPKFYAPENTVFLPPLRHTYLLAFVPSGFWPRLMSRVLSDPSIIRLAQEGCGLTDDESRLLKWTKWRTGMILRFGNVTLLSLEELSGKLFTGPGSKMNIMLEGGRWEQHPLDITVYGINVEVPDVFPLLRYAELHPRQQTRTPHVQREEKVERKKNTEERKFSGSLTANPGDQDVRPRRWTLTEKVGDIARKVRSYTTQTQTQTTTSSGDRDNEDDSGFIVLPTCNHQESNCSTSESEEEREGEEVEIQRVRGVLRMEEVHSKFERLKRLRAHGMNSAEITESNTAKVTTPKLTEENNDKMRAGLLSKIVDHITLLVEDWFSGVRPRILVVPCPHCSHGLPPGPIPLLRSFSINPNLRPSNEMAQDQVYPYSANPPPIPQLLNISSVSQTGSQRGRSRGRGTGGHAGGETDRREEMIYYAFQYDECVVQARNVPNMCCPNHQELPLEYIAPDTLFLTEGKDILLGPDQLIKEEKLGRGAFATVYKAKVKRGISSQGQQHYEDVAIKALGRKPEDDLEDLLSDEEDKAGGEGGAKGPAPMNRGNIVQGFNNLKKELSILSPLRHPNIVQLFGVSVEPLGLVLELAPKGDLKAILKEYKEAQNHLQPAAIQAVVRQIAEGLRYLHSLRIIYRDLKCENVLVWYFPTPHTILSTTTQVGSDIIKVKISDYGISQFVTSQGAKGHVGTPGFMAPEILKYLGKEAYNEKVDIFSYAMLIYELITFRVPFEHLTPNQANQANESGTRPTLKRKDLPCPVLIRELMVWCWQQEEENRPKASQIIDLTSADQFLRLADAIRINNFGSQVAGSCYRIIKSSFNKMATTPITPAHSHSHFFSPRTSGFSRRSSKNSPYKFVRPQTIAGSIPSSKLGSNISYPESRSTEYGVMGATINHKYSSRNITHASLDSDVSKVSTGNAGLVISAEIHDDALVHEASVAPRHDMVLSPTRRDHMTTDHMTDENNSRTSTGNKQVSNVSFSEDTSLDHQDSVPGNQQEPESPCSGLSLIATGPGLEQNIEPHVGPSLPAHPTSLPPLMIKEEEEEEEEEDEEEDHKMYQVWGASCFTHCSVATVMEYCGQFVKIEDIDLGDSPVLCITMVNDKVWMGFQIGYLCIYDADTHDPIAQIWVRQGIPILSIAHIPSLNTVYIGMSDGSVKSYSNTIDDIIETSGDSIVTEMDPLNTYQDTNQVSVCLLPVLYSHTDGEMQHHLWVGQSNREITVLNAVDLSIVDFIDSPLDKTLTPRFLNSLTYTHLTCSISITDDVQAEPFVISTPETDVHTEIGNVPNVLVYGAVEHGQYVTCWDAQTRDMITSVDCMELLSQWKSELPPQVSALQYYSDHLYIGLVTGEVLVLGAPTLNLLTILHCHRSHVRSFLAIDLKKLLPNPTQSPAFTPALSPSHPFLITDDNTVTYKTGPIQLMSFGTGFRAYYESADSIDYTQSSFLLVWESGQWTKMVT